MHYSLSVNNPTEGRGQSPHVLVGTLMEQKFNVNMDHDDQHFIYFLRLHQSSPHVRISYRITREKRIDCDGWEGSCSHTWKRQCSQSPHTAAYKRRRRHQHTRFIRCIELRQRQCFIVYLRVYIYRADACVKYFAYVCVCVLNYTCRLYCSTDAER